jgi:cytochrome c
MSRDSLGLFSCRCSQDHLRQQLLQPPHLGREWVVNAFPLSRAAAIYNVVQYAASATGDERQLERFRRPERLNDLLCYRRRRVSRSSRSGSAEGVERGRSFAEANCARCHAIGPTGKSPIAKAPPFRTLRNRYPVEDIVEALAEGTAHSQMLQLELSAVQIDDLIAYLKSLER